MSESSNAPGNRPDGRAPRLGELSAAEDVGNALPSGHRLHEFEVVQVIGEGGFSIVYRALDLQLQRTVALKEYMPSSLAARKADQGVTVRSERQRETFGLGLRSFVNEARQIASFDHPSLVKVYRFWEQNETAYMVMPLYEGPTLKAYLRDLGAPPDEAWLKRMLVPLLNALEVIHAGQCYHRDIAPDNILLLGPLLAPLLLDFGAARRVITDATQALTVILKPGYAPVEQYAEVPSMKQGAWTDIYALSAVLYMAITGRAPMPSVGRLIKDDMAPISQLAQGRYPAPFLAAIDRGLAVRPEDRPQDIPTLRSALFGSEDTSAAGAHGSASAFGTTPLHVTSANPLPFDDHTILRAPPGPAPAPQPLAQAERPNSPAPSKKAVLLVGTAVMLIAALAGGWFVIQGRAKPAAVVAASPPAVAPVIAPAALPGETPRVVAPPARAPYSAVTILEDIVRYADPRVAVDTRVDQASLVIKRDKMQLRIKSSENGYLYVLFSDTSSQMSLLFPNGLDKDNRITAGTEVTLPRKAWTITADGPPGTDHVVTMVSRVPRDFTAAGLRAQGEIRQFDTATLQRLWEAGRAGVSALAGTAQCADTAACDAAYGATMVHISEIAPSASK